jgi:argininosuccinate lyase
VLSQSMLISYIAQEKGEAHFRQWMVSSSVRLTLSADYCRSRFAMTSAVSASNGHSSDQANGHTGGVAFTEARLGKPPSALLLQYDSIPLVTREKGHFDQYCQIDLAHLVMLVEQGIVSRSVARKILPVLCHIRDGKVEKLQVDYHKGSLLLQIEAAVSAELGEDVAGVIHTGRSRIDQGATARRLFKRNKLLEVMRGIGGLQEVLIEIAKNHVDTVMPTYTHMQHAQPGNFAHFLLAYTERFHDDFARCADTFARINKSVLGMVGLSGTSWPIDRHRTASLLGFDGLVVNSRLAREAYYSE